MSLNKLFERFLKEGPDSDVFTMQGAPKVGAMDSPSGNSADDVDVSVANIHMPYVLDRINGFLSGVTEKPYINPYTPVNAIRNKLAIAGLQFEDPFFVGDSGIIEKKLCQFGGRFGWDPSIGDVTSEDGISHKIPGGLKIVFRWMKVGGLYNLDVQIMKGDETPSPLGESKLPASEKIYEIKENNSIVEVTEELMSEAAKKKIGVHKKKESNIFKVAHDGKDRLFTFAADVGTSEVRKRIKNALGHSNFSLGAPKKKVVYEGFDLEEMIVNEVSPPGMEKWTASPDVKKHFKAQYGDRWKKVMYSTAWARHNESVAEPDVEQRHNFSDAPYIPDVLGSKPVDFGTGQRGEKKADLDFQSHVAK